MVAVLDMLEALGFGGEGENEGGINKERKGKVFGFGNKHGGESRWGGSTLQRKDRGIRAGETSEQRGRDGVGSQSTYMQNERQ